MTTRSQEDCIARRGKCAGCPNALESMRGACMARWTREVIAQIGEPRGGKPAPVEGVGVRIYDKPCALCGEIFEARHNNTKYCPPCQMVKKREHSRHAHKRRVEHD